MERDVARHLKFGTIVPGHGDLHNASRQLCNEEAFGCLFWRRGRPGAWRAHALRGAPAELVRVGKGAQEQFLEYAHYLPERSVQAAVERQKLAAFAALEGTALTQPLSAEQARPDMQPLNIKSLDVTDLPVHNRFWETSGKEQAVSYILVAAQARAGALNQRATRMSSSRAFEQIEQHSVRLLACARACCLLTCAV